MPTGNLINLEFNKSRERKIHKTAGVFQIKDEKNLKRKSKASMKEVPHGIV